MITVKVTQLGLATEDLSAPKRVVLAMQIDRWPGEARWRAVFVEGAVGETDYTHDQFQFDHDETDGPLPHVWLGVSVEDQARAEDRIPHLLATPAKVRFVSAEPLLGPVDFNDLRPANSPLRGDPFPLTGRLIWPAARGFEDSLNAGSGRTAKLDWVIVGGESGPDARPMHPDWPRAIRDQCAAAGVPFFFKQWGEWSPRILVEHILVGEGCIDHGFNRSSRVAWAGKGQAGSVRLERIGKARAGRVLDGRTHDDMPAMARNEKETAK